MATKLYEMTVEVRIRVEAGCKADARGDANEILRRIAASMPTGSFIKHADPSELRVI